MTQLVVVEDNEDLLDEVEYIARDIGIAVTRARCVEEGIVLLKKCFEEHPAEAILLLPDWMLPASKVELKELDDLVEKRETIIFEYLSLGEEKIDSEALETARGELDALDKEIQKRVDENGGAKILEAVKEHLARLRIAIFSARLRGEIEGQVTAILGRSPEAWFEKPVNPALIDRWLREQVKETPTCTASPS